MRDKINYSIRQLCRKLHIGPPMKAAIVYLVRFSERDIQDFEKSLKQLKEFFLDEFDYPVLAFHEADLDDATKRKIIRETGVNVQFELIKFEVPKFLSHLDIPERLPPSGATMGYRHMCRFFSGMIFRQPVICKYDWFWRLDTDSFLLEKINYDVFKFMDDNNFEYGYNRICRDQPLVVVGLGEAAKKYLKDNNITPNFLHKFEREGVWDRFTYFTNFAIAKVSFWRRKDVDAFFNFIDRNGWIYTRRWGDAPLHLIAISTFMKENKTHCFNDIAYKHQHFVIPPSNPEKQNGE